MSAREATTRRAFLQRALSAGGGFVLGISFGGSVRAAVLRPDRPLPADFALTAFLRILGDGRIQFVAKHDEMGQGIHTGLAIAFCEELEIDVAAVEVDFAPADPRYGHSTFGAQVTGGSTSTWTSFDQMRKAGAMARDMLVRAAAARFGVSPSECEAKNGEVRRRGTEERLTYAELAADAAGLEPDEGVALKAPAAFTRIGKPTPRVDSAAKVRGTAPFSFDRRAPNMLVAMVERCPYFGGRLKSFDATAARRVDGVRAVYEVRSGVAVLATDFWAATKGRAALVTEWDAGPGGDLDSERLRARYLELCEQEGMVARDEGDTAAAIANAADVHSAVYEVPFMAHAPMEPLSCMVELRADGGARITTGSQMLGGDHPAAAAVLGVDPSVVEFQNSYLGGGFGRRANPAADFTVEAIHVALGKRDHEGLSAQDRAAPVKTVWTREDDLRGGWYRPLWVNAIEVGLGDGKILGWRHRVVGQSIAAGTAFEPVMVQDGIDTTSVEGAADMPHGVPNLRVELHSPKLPVPVQWWRSVGHSNTAFAKESMLDECAERLGRDPYELRRSLLAGHSRLLGVLDAVAEKAGWGGPTAAGVGRGISVHESFQGFAAHVVEASIVDGRPRVHRVVCAIDCGLVVNPDQVVSQMQGAAIFALSAALEAEITFENGRVVQSNFHDFPIVRMHESPAVEVHIVDSGEKMGGIGEVGVPGVASALCSALRAAGGPRIRRLPIGDQLG